MSDDLRASDENDTVIEELVSYLDGELAPEARREVELRLARDADYRRHLNQLQKSWDLLDHLPQSTVDPSFTHSTVAIVAVTASDDADQARASLKYWRRLALLLGSGSVAIAFLIGYFAVSTRVNRPNTQLLEDLPVIEEVDQYLYADDVHFLETLRDEGLFQRGEELSDEP